jgi:hypothetical protein
MVKVLACACLMACAASAHAETWHFTYQGFHDTVTGSFDADRRLDGSFTGTDYDGDNILTRSEISSLMLHGRDYVACTGDSNEYYHCGADAFSYAVHGALHFSAGEYGSDPEGWVGRGHYFIAGEGEYGYYYNPALYEEWSYLWTPQTTFTISPAPEPATWALLLAGLPLAWRASRRRQP